MNAHAFYANKEAFNDLLVMLLNFGLGPITGLRSQFINRLLNGRAQANPFAK